MEKVQAWTRRAARLGAPTVRIFAGNLPKGDTLEDAQNEFEGQKNEIMKSLGNKVYATLDKYAKENGFSLVLDVSNQNTPVLWASQATNITKPIVDAYNATSGVPAPAAPAKPAASSVRPGITPAKPAATAPKSPSATTPKSPTT